MKKADELFGKEVMKFYLCPPFKKRKQNEGQVH
jgi:hypothetical protein